MKAKQFASGNRALKLILAIWIVAIGFGVWRGFNVVIKFEEYTQLF